MKTWVILSLCHDRSPRTLVKIKKKINKVHDDFFDFLNHDFLICNKSSESHFAGQVHPGLGTRYPDGIYDLVM